MRPWQKTVLFVAMIGLIAEAFALTSVAVGHTPPATSAVTPPTVHWNSLLSDAEDASRVFSGGHSAIHGKPSAMNISYSHIDSVLPALKLKRARSNVSASLGVRSARKN